MTRNHPPETEPDCDVVVVGAGFAGIYALWQARQRGLSVRGFERGSDVGGTWYWNAYPGARCDVESYNYAYFFDNDIVRDWDWSDACAGHDEIQRYLRFAAERCDVLKDIAFNTKVQSVSYDEDSGLWSLRTAAGETVVCRYAILAIGALSDPKAPDISGVDDFAGEAYFTSKWPKDGSVDLSGKRVGIIGTGSSGVQVIPEVANVAAEVYVFQRTANYVTATRSGPMDPNVVAKLRVDPQAIRREFRGTYGGHTPLEMGDERYLELDEAGRERALQRAWDGKYVQLAFRDAYLPEVNDAISNFIRQRMHDQVDDQWTADHLVPWDHPYGGKRPCMSNVYLETFNQSHVHLIALPETPIEAIVPEGIRTTAQTIELDMIVYATGFDAISGPVFAIDISGMGGRTMKDAWVDGPMNYLGTMVHGFPNLFLPSSAMSPSVLSNMATLAEQQVDFIFDTIDWLEQHGCPLLHPLPKSQEHWREETLHYAERRPGALSTKSWYSGANVPGKPRVFMVYCGGFKRYHETCYGELADGFPGYEIMESPRREMTG
ncbi:MAG: cation diffusion facilitator CzcD-associated flavoprotein CzcO [Gammaproteobacteria bacterium]|jgi:cation diffusion facilitator CzcD-associated flavoprotein CzcO